MAKREIAFHMVMTKQEQSKLKSLAKDAGESCAATLRSFIRVAWEGRRLANEDIAKDGEMHLNARKHTPAKL
jgi:hypothetical protein